MTTRTTDAPFRVSCAMTWTSADSRPSSRYSRSITSAKDAGSSQAVCGPRPSATARSVEVATMRIAFELQAWGHRRAWIDLDAECLGSLGIVAPHGCRHLRLRSVLPGTGARGRSAWRLVREIRRKWRRLHRSTIRRRTSSGRSKPETSSRVGRPRSMVYSSTMVSTPGPLEPAGTSPGDAGNRRARTRASKKPRD